MSAGGWRGYFTDLLVVLEGTRWRVHHGGRAQRRATVRGAERRASRGTRKGRPMLRERVRRPPGRTATERPLAAGPPDAAHFDRATRDAWVGQVSIEHLGRGWGGDVELLNMANKGGYGCSAGRNQRVPRTLTSSPMVALPASYALPPGPGHLVTPFSVLEVSRMASATCATA